jgi:hypothetical protein
MGKFLVRSMASLAEIDAERDEAAAGIGKQVHRDRTRAALAAAKARGTKLGGYRGGPVPDPMLGGAARREAADAFAARLAPTLSEMRGRKLSLHHMAAELTAKEIRTPSGPARSRGGRRTPADGCNRLLGSEHRHVERRRGPIPDLSV